MATPLDPRNDTLFARLNAEQEAQADYLHESPGNYVYMRREPIIEFGNAPEPSAFCEFVVPAFYRCQAPHDAPIQVEFVDSTCPGCATPGTVRIPDPQNFGGYLHRYPSGGTTTCAYRMVLDLYMPDESTQTHSPEPTPLYGATADTAAPSWAESLAPTIHAGVDGKAKCGATLGAVDSAKQTCRVCAALG